MNTIGIMAALPGPKLADHGVGNFSVHALKVSVVEMKFMLALGFRLTEIQFRGRSKKTGLQQLQLAVKPQINPVRKGTSRPIFGSQCIQVGNRPVEMAGRDIDPHPLEHSEGGGSELAEPRATGKWLARTTLMTGRCAGGERRICRFRKTYWLH